LTSGIGSLEKKWNNMRDYIIEEGVHFFGFFRLKGKRTEKLGFVIRLRKL
jgi:hypothetical protein